MRHAGPVLALTAAAAVGALLALDPAVAGGDVPEPLALHGTASAPAAQPPLHLGSRGVHVRALQHGLVALGYLPPGSANGVYGRRTWHAVVAFQGWQGLHRDGIVGPRTRVALASADRPRPWTRIERGLALDLRRQVMLVVSRGRTLRAVHISSAAPGYLTPRGHFHIYRRERMSWSVPYRVWMPYALYFSGGWAIHGYNPVPTYPASHGCVRVPLSEASLVYSATPLHAPVVIR